MIPIPESRIAERTGPKAFPLRSRRRGGARCKGALAAVAAALAACAGVAVAGTTVPQTHPGRQDAPSARALAAHEQAKQFSELLGRPFSHEWREDSVGWTDLHYAALLGLPGVVAALCDAGLAADTRLKRIQEFGEDLIRTLATLGHEFELYYRNEITGRVFARESRAETPLMIAVEVNARDAAAELIACGADVNARDLIVVYGPHMVFENGTPLNYAASNNSLDMVKLLIEHGADVNASYETARFGNDVTPLHSAARNDSLDMAKLLIERGADVNARNHYGRWVRGEADWILFAPLNYAASNNSLDMAKLLVEHGADVNPISEDREDARLYALPPLHSAAGNDSLDVAKLLIEYGADVNSNSTPWGPGSPLHFRFDVAKLLIEYGADRWRPGSAPLHSAASNDSLDMAKLLIERGADVNLEDGDGDTPLDLALSGSNSEEMQALLRRHGGKCAEQC